MANGGNFFKPNFPPSVLKFLEKREVTRYSVLASTDAKNVWVFLGVKFLWPPELRCFGAFSKISIFFFKSRLVVGFYCHGPCFFFLINFIEV